MVNRFIWFLTVCCAVAVLTGSPNPAPAQDANPPAAPAAAPGAAAPADAEQKTDETAARGESIVWWLIRVSGWIGLVILILSIYFMATVIRLFTELRSEVAAPPELVQQCEDLIKQRNFKGVYDAARQSDSFLGRVLSVGLAEMPNGLPEARDTMERVGEAETVELERKISMLAVLGTLGPMIGLIGTLKGMITSFSVIARFDEQLKASEVAGGISEALVLTFEGVALAVLAIYFFALFRNRVSTISVSTMLQADHLLRKFAHAARSKGPAAGSPPPMPAPAPMRG